MTERFTVRRALSWLSLAFGALLACGACRDEARSSRASSSPPVVVISIDTLRADRLPAWGYRGVETPAIDALARDGIVFENAYAQVPLTLPSHVSMLTGKSPDVHGVRNNQGYRYSVVEHPPFTMALRAAGYDTGAAVSAYSLRAGTGMADAFDDYDDGVAGESGVAMGSLQRPGTITLDVARGWITRHGSRPFFFFFHIYEPHMPWTPPEPFRARYGDSYDGEVAAADAVVGQLIDHLRVLGLYDASAVIVVSDHGEGLGDHGESGHGVFLYREAIHVPLIVKLPRSQRAGERVRDVVQLSELAATISAIAGVEAPAGSTGRNLLDPEALETKISAYSETFFPRLHLGWSELRSAIDDRYHYIEAPRAELYDLVTDPREKTSVASEQRRVFSAMRAALDKVDKRLANPASVDREEAKKLAALGYVSSVVADDSSRPDPKDRIADFDLVMRAMGLSAEGNVSEAVSMLGPLLVRNPGHTDAWYVLASNLEKLGRDDEAVEAYKQGIRSSPGVVDEFALTVAEFMLARGRLDEAARHADLVAGRDPVGAALMHARIAIAHGDPAGAEARLDATEFDAVSSLSAAVVRAEVRGLQGQNQEGITILQSARRETIDRKIRVERLNREMGKLYAASGNPLEAEEAFRREIKFFPDDLGAYLDLARLYGRSGRSAEAARLLDEMVELNRYPRAFGEAAAVLDEIGEPRLAARFRSRMTSR